MWTWIFFGVSLRVRRCINPLFNWIAQKQLHSGEAFADYYCFECVCVRLLLALSLVHYICCYLNRCGCCCCSLFTIFIYSSVYCIHGPMPINVYTFLARKNSITLLLILLLLLLLYCICGYSFGYVSMWSIRVTDCFRLTCFFSLSSKYWYNDIALTTFQFWSKTRIHIHCAANGTTTVKTNTM